MIKEFVLKYEEKKEELKQMFKVKHPGDYDEIVKNVVTILNNSDDYGSIDPQRIHQICDGDYQGTIIYVIGATGYQPSDYWYVKVGYGSCSGCDTLQGIKYDGRYDDDKPSESQVSEYMVLALHIIQGLKKMGDEE